MGGHENSLKISGKVKRYSTSLFGKQKRNVFRVTFDKIELSTHEKAPRVAAFIAASRGADDA
ncbi:hypothetical protein HaloA020_00460 [Halomonas sp. A020]|nr:hypothetical protein HaloA020_00460 [Halomonas sp. A020]